MRTVFFVFPWTFLIVLFYFRLFFRSGYCSLFFPVVQVFFSVECFVVGVRHLFLCVGYVVGTVEFGEMNFEYFALYVLWVWMDGNDGSWNSIKNLINFTLRNVVVGVVVFYNRIPRALVILIASMMLHDV